MKPYTDVFKKPLDKKEVATVVMVVIMQKTTSVIEVQRCINIGAGKLNKIFQLLEDAGVISSEPRSILLIHTVDGRFDLRVVGCLSMMPLRCAACNAGPSGE